MPPEHHPAAILLLAGSTEEGPAAHLLWRLRVGKETRRSAAAQGLQAASSSLESVAAAPRQLANRRGPQGSAGRQQVH